MKKRINAVRKALMQSLTRGIGARGVTIADVPINKGEIKRILVCRPNHRLGNLLLITPLLHEIVETFPDARIDLFVKGFLAPQLFKNNKHVENIIQLPKKPASNLGAYLRGWFTIKKTRYDMVVNVILDSSSGRISAQVANATYRFFGDGYEGLAEKYSDYRHIAKYPVYNFRYFLSSLGLNSIARPIVPLDLQLSAAELAKGKMIIRDIVGNDGKIIALYTFATAKKCYSPSWWEQFYERLKLEYSHYNIIEVLPVENVSQIAFKAPSYYSKDIREIGAVIANTDVFIGADSGIMHLASAAHAPTVGLFAITDPAIYEPYNSGSASINTNEGTLDDWMNVVRGVLGE